MYEEVGKQLSVSLELLCQGRRELVMRESAGRRSSTNAVRDGEIEVQVLLGVNEWG